MSSPEFLALQHAVAGRYSLDRELGRGGMGVVFLARDVALDRPVAIKLLPPELAADPAFRERFLREARTAAGLSHPHVVQIYAVEERGDLVFFVMAFVDGETLGARVRRDGPLPAAEVMRITQEVAWALAHAHVRGVIHRDVKPDNVLLEYETGRAMVTDFGIARMAERGDTPPSGSVRGTPQYMSPEQAAGGAIDARSDLYSLGVTAFFAATGRLPFEATSVAGYLTQHATAAAPPVRSLSPRLPLRFSAAVDRCLAKDPAVRPPSADALAGEVAAVQGSLTRVPVPLARFLREADTIGAEAASLFGGAIGGALIFEIVRATEGDFLGILFGIETLFAAVLAGLSVARMAQLIPLARRLRSEGYGHRALAAGLELQERSDAAEGTAAPAPDTRRAWLTAGGGVAAAAAGAALSTAFSSDPVVALGMAMVIGAPILTIRGLWSQLGLTGVWHRLLKGRFGRTVFKLGGVGLKDRPEALGVGGERTEVALGHAAEQLFAALPAAQRERLGDVPTLIAKLEADALALRERAAEPGAGERLATAVAALETLRLDLLRLHAGSGTIDELTQDIEAARQLGEEIDIEIEARREVERY
jgi:serine/threonine-protein kinase